jgi:hypothetical protein
VLGIVERCVRRVLAGRDRGDHVADEIAAEEAEIR